MLDILNLYTSVCQLYLNKTKEKKVRKILKGRKKIKTSFTGNIPFPVGGLSEHEASRNNSGTS